MYIDIQPAAVLWNNQYSFPVVLLYERNVFVG